MADIKVNIFLISRRLKALQQSAYTPIRKETGLSQMELQILFFFFNIPKNLTVGEIHKQTGFNKGQISVCVAKLLKGGYLKKADGYNINGIESYLLTERGLEIAKKIEKNTSQGRKILFKGFTKKDAENCIHYLDRILKNAEEAQQNNIKF